MTQAKPVFHAIIHDPTGLKHRQYSPRISTETWSTMKPHVLRIHSQGICREKLLQVLEREYHFAPQPRQLWKKMRAWGLFIYNVAHRRNVASHKSKSTSSSTQCVRVPQRDKEFSSELVSIPYALPDSCLGTSTKPAHYFSWSLTMPDYYEHRLWTLLSLRTAPIWRSKGWRPRPFVVRYMRNTMFRSTGSGDYRQEMNRIFGMSKNPLLMPTPDVVMLDALDLGRMQELLGNLRKWLCCPFAQTECLRWMFLVMLDLALRSSVLMILVNEDQKHGEYALRPNEVKVHIEAAGQMLGIIHRKTTSGREKLLIDVLADVLHTCEALIGADDWKLDLIENRLKDKRLK